MPLVCAAALTFACSRPDATPRTDSTPDTVRAPTSASSPDSDWVSELGELLVVPSDTDNAAVVLFPASPSPRLISSARLTLMNAAGDTTTTRLAMSPSDSLQCGDAATVRITGAVRAPWSVGLLARSVLPLRMDSIEALPSADSARLAADVARLAAGLPTQSESRFTGLPFIVLSARRFEAHGVPMLVAHVVRRLNQEAAPLEEHTLLIAERPSSSAKDQPYTVTYRQRSEGSEETAEHFDVLSAVSGRESTLLLLARDQESRTQYEVLERPNTGGWRRRWTRTLSC